MSLDNHEYHESFLNYLLRDILREFDSIIFLTTLCVEIILFRFINFSFFFFSPPIFLTLLHRCIDIVRIYRISTSRLSLRRIIQADSKCTFVRITIQETWRLKNASIGNFFFFFHDTTRNVDYSNPGIQESIYSFCFSDRSAL